MFLLHFYWRSHVTGVSIIGSAIINTYAIVWSLWNYKNDIIFNKKGTANFLQVIRMATHWIHEWSFLLPEAQQTLMDSGCTRLETVARDIFNQVGWRLTRRIQDA
jgi:hypothetical protein